MKFQTAGGDKSAVHLRRGSQLCNCRYTLDAFILARHWVLAVVRKTGSGPNQSGHPVSGGDSRAQRQPVRQGVWQPSQATGPYLCHLHKCA